MRSATLLLALGLVLIGAKAQRPSEKIADAFRHNVEIGVQSVAETLQKIGEEVHQHASEAAEGYAKVLDSLRQRRGDIAAALHGDAEGPKRRLHTLGGAMQNVQGFLGDMLGANWTSWVPSSWASPSFDWSHLGEFDYTSNLADFMDAHELQNLTTIHSVKDLTHSMSSIEEAFCIPETFKPSKKVPASCVGPSVTIAVTPKVCVLEKATKQIVCEPAKLVLTKIPGSCTHKYHSASTWTGKSCSITGGAGFSDSVVIGGGSKAIPLTQVDLSYEFK